jgi:hypothetical protein
MSAVQRHQFESGDLRMLHNIALAAAFLFVSNLAGIPVTAHNSPVTDTSKTPQKLPASAARHLSRYRSRTGHARRTYEATIKAEQARLERTLRRELQVTTKRRDFAGAQAILGAMRDLHSSDMKKDAKPSEVGAATAQIEQTLLGKWSVHCGPKFQTVWTFQRDGIVFSVNGAPKGHWRWEQENRRILITWDETAWDSLNLPLNEKGTFGDTYHRQGWSVEAVKLL